MNNLRRTRSFARRRCPRVILSHLLDGGYCSTEDICNLDYGRPFHIRTIRYWVYLLVRHGYLRGATDLKKDGRKKLYYIPQEMRETVGDLMRRIPEAECQRLQ
jgi:hypothetical protein